MTPEQYQQVKALIELALEREPAQRLSFLAEACAGDELLYREAEQMIAADAEASGFLENPAHKSGDSGRTLKMGGETSAPTLLKIGEIFLSKYELISLIGKGGMGLVYKARHVELGTMFAIKVLSSHLIQDNEAIERFKREARTAAKLEHPNTVRVFDYGVQEMTCYLVMEFLKGESLRERLKKKRRLYLSEVIHFAEQVCDALSVVHDNGIIHRDLKPDNIFFHHDGEKEIVKLLDFGIAKLSTFSYGSESLTNPGSVFGTPQYMSPEQCEGKMLDGRSDLYSLGIILYEMLAGRRPFDADSLLSYMYAHVHTEPLELSQVVSEIPTEVSRVIMRSLCKDAAERFQSAEALLQALLDANSMSSSSPTLQLQPVLLTQKQLSPIVVSNPEKPKSPRYYLGATILALTILGAIGFWQLQQRYFAANTIKNNLVNIDKPLPTIKPVVSAGDVEPTIKLTDKNFVLIRGGDFKIGRDTGDCPAGIPDCQIADDEAPSHIVTLLPYYLSKYEVTNHEYQEFIVATKYPPPTYWHQGSFPKSEANLPVTNVGWNDVVKYCEWRSRRDGINYRLPSEEEWEHGARGNDVRFFYPWGDIWDEKFAIANGKTGKPVAIDQPPNNTLDSSSSGIFAMAGNVSEWTNSKFKVYPGSKYQIKGQDNDCRIVKGGSYLVPPSELRTTFRAWKLPYQSLDDVGFRLAVSAVGDEHK